MLAEETSQTLPPSPSLNGSKEDFGKSIFSWCLKNADILAGVVGGPMVVGCLTPQRNVMTLAAKDVHSSFFGLYKQVFQAGVIKAFRGGSRPTLAAVPQFSMIGPAYLYVYKLTDSRGTAVWAASLGESLLTFAPQRRNAQIQYNAVRPASQHLEVAPMSRISGPGFGFHVWRNAVAMMGIRLFSPYTEQVVRHIPTMDERPETKAILSDFSASIVSSFLSMPFNHVFSWACCSPELAEMSQLQRLQAYANFLIGNYCAPGRLSLLGRDLCVRIGYTGFLFTGYHIVERQMHKLAAGEH